MIMSNTISISNKNSEKEVMLSLKDDNINDSAIQENNNIALNANDEILNQLVHQDLQTIQHFIIEEYSQAIIKVTTDCDYINLEKILDVKNKAETMLTKASKEHESFFKSSGQNNDFDLMQTSLNQYYNFFMSAIIPIAQQGLILQDEYKNAMIDLDIAKMKECQMKNDILMQKFLKEHESFLKSQGRDNELELMNDDLEFIKDRLNQEYNLDISRITDQLCDDLAQQKLADSSIEPVNSFAAKSVEKTLVQQEDLNEEDDIINNDEEDQSQGTILSDCAVENSGEAIDVVDQ